MSRGINKVILIGNVGNDPEVYKSNGRISVVSVSVATSDSWKDSDGVAKTHTEWHKVKAFGKLAELVARFVRKGSKIYVEGSLKTNKWTDKQGVERYSTDINAVTIQFLDGIGSASQKSDTSSKDYEKASGGSIGYDEEIPF